MDVKERKAALLYYNETENNGFGLKGKFYEFRKKHSVSEKTKEGHPGTIVRDHVCFTPDDIEYVKDGVSCMDVYIHVDSV